jgi:hypothetical protein
MVFPVVNDAPAGKLIPLAGVVTQYCKSKLVTSELTKAPPFEYDSKHEAVVPEYFAFVKTGVFGAAHFAEL